MPAPRLTKQEILLYAEMKQRNQEKRRLANQIAREKRRKQGLRLLELSVPGEHLVEIRALAARLISGISAGRELQLATTAREEVVAPHPSPDAEREVQDGAALPLPEIRGADARVRKSAQTARRRAKKAADGEFRTTFAVPGRHVVQFRRTMGLVVDLISAGCSVTLVELGAPVASATPAADPAPLDHRAARAKIVMPDGSGPGDDGERSALFDDIQAAARIRWTE